MNIRRYVCWISLLKFVKFDISSTIDPQDFRYVRMCMYGKLSGIDTAL